MKQMKPIIITWLIVTVAYTVWSVFAYYRSEQLFFHTSGGLFVSGVVLFGFGMFSRMSAAGLFDGFSIGFKKNRQEKLKKIDPDYEEDEADDPEVRAVRKRASSRWILAGVGSITLSYLVALF